MTRELYEVLPQCLKFCCSGFAAAVSNNFPILFFFLPQLPNYSNNTIFLCPDEALDPIPTDVIKFGRKFWKIGLKDYPTHSLQETLKI